MKAMGKDEILIARSRKPLRLPNIFNPAARSSSVVVRKTVPHGSNRVYKYKVRKSLLWIQILLNTIQHYL
jgi:hypothetical protein